MVSICCMSAFYLVCQLTSYGRLFVSILVAFAINDACMVRKFYNVFPSHCVHKIITS